MHDNHVAERGPWEERHQGEPDHFCWVRRPGGKWKMIGSAPTEAEAYSLFLNWPDLCATPLVLLMADGDPNEHRAEGGKGSVRLRRESLDGEAADARIRKRPVGRPKSPPPPEDHTARVAYYEHLIEKGIPLFEEGECRREAA
jgi:hypothetical protein